mgnify:FL=1
MKMKRLLTYILGTVLTLAPNTAYGDDYQIISYKATKEQACLELKVKTELETGAEKDELITICDGTNGERDDEIDDVTFNNPVPENIGDLNTCIGVNYQQIRDNLIECHVNVFLNAVSGDTGEVIRFDTKKRYISLEAENKVYLLYTNSENKTHRFCVLGNGFSVSIKQDPFTEHLVNDLYERALEIRDKNK